MPSAHIIWKEFSQSWEIVPVLGESWLSGLIQGLPKFLSHNTNSFNLLISLTRVECKLDISTSERAVQKIAKASGSDMMICIFKGKSFGNFLFRVIVFQNSWPANLFTINYQKVKNTISNLKQQVEANVILQSSTLFRMKLWCGFLFDNFI